MSKPTYMNTLSVTERAAAIKLGCCMSLGNNGISMDDFKKSADLQSVLSGASLIPKSILIASLLGGIPLGIAGHVVGRSMDTDNRKEREALDRLRYYQKFTAGMDRGMGRRDEEEE